MDIPDWLALRFHEDGPWHTEHVCTQHLAAILAQDDRRRQNLPVVRQSCVISHGQQGFALKRDTCTRVRGSIVLTGCCAVMPLPSWQTRSSRDHPADQLQTSRQRPLRMRKARSDLALLRKTLDSSTRLSRNSQAVLLNGGAATGAWAGGSGSGGGDAASESPPGGERGRATVQVPAWVRKNVAVLTALLRTLGAGDVPRWLCEECCRSSALFAALERDGLLQRCRPSDVHKVDILHILCCA